MEKKYLVGQKINPHPHLHCLVTEGDENQEGGLEQLAEFRHSPLAGFFQHKFFAHFLEERLVTEILVKKISAWRHSGFTASRQVSSFLSTI